MIRPRIILAVAVGAVGMTLLYRSGAPAAVCWFAGVACALVLAELDIWD